MQHPIPCLFMRGCTSQGLFFHEADLPLKATLRDRALLASMGSPDKRQIDGLGGAQVRKVHRHFHVPAAHTMVGRIILENA